MCFAPPAQVLEVLPGRAVVARGEARLEVATFLIEEELHVGDWVAVQAQRHAIQRLTEEEAEEMIRLYDMIGEALRGEGARG